MAKLSVVLHDEMYQQVLKNDKCLSLNTFASMDFYTEVDNDAVLSKAIQLASTSKRVLFTRKNVDKLEWELQEIGPINTGTLNVQIEHNLPKFDWVGVESDAAIMRPSSFMYGPMTASINSKVLGLISPNYDDNSTNTKHEKDGEA